MLHRNELLVNRWGGVPTHRHLKNRLPSSDLPPYGGGLVCGNAAATNQTGEEGAISSGAISTIVQRTERW